MSSIITKMQKHPKQKFHRRWSLNPNCYVFHYKSRKITFWDLKKKKNSLWTFILKTASKICHLKSTLLYGFNSTPVSSSVHGSLRRLAQELWSYQGSCPPRSQTYHTDGCKPCKTKKKRKKVSSEPSEASEHLVSMTITAFGNASSDLCGWLTWRQTCSRLFSQCPPRVQAEPDCYWPAWRTSHTY